MIHHGDCLSIMATMERDSIDSIVTDPPYGLSFMGKQWDHGVPGSAFWVEALRIAKPGAHLLAFGGTRTYHRLACAIEDAGWEIRDCLGWLYGSGFPKSLDVSKAIDKARDDRPDILRVTTFLAAAAARAGKSRSEVDAHMGTSDMAGWWLSTLKHRCQCPQWDQWLALKALLAFGDEMDAEVWRLNGRKGQPGEAWDRREVIGSKLGLPGYSLAEDKGRGVACVPHGDSEKECEITAPATDAARQWAGWGTALKPAWEPVILARKPLAGTVAENVQRHGTGALNIDGCRVETDELKGKVYNNKGDALTWGGTYGKGTVQGNPIGRWPANIAHDGSEEVLAVFPEVGSRGNKGPSAAGGGMYGHPAFVDQTPFRDGITGSASRFFYCAKANKKDRGAENNHPTVKPNTLMRYLCRLVTPPNGIVLDPFMGSGSTGKAALEEGFRFMGIEMNKDYCEIAQKRLQEPPKKLGFPNRKRTKEQTRDWLESQFPVACRERD